MFGIFKTQPDPGDIFRDGVWQLFKGELDGTPILVRVNSHLKPFAGKTELTLKIGFALPLNAPNEGGLPDPEENRLLGDIEVKIADAMESAGEVVLALVITTGTFKEFVFYSKPDLDIRSTHEKLMSEVKSHELQCYAEMNTSWEAYKEYSD